MIVQVLLLIAIWSGIYELHRQALVFSVLREKTDLRRQVMGKWQSTKAPSVFLELLDERFTFWRDGKIFREGEYAWAKSELTMWTRSSSGIAGYWLLQYRVDNEDLVMWDNSSNVNGDWYLLLNVLGFEAARQVFAEAKALRFRRTPN